MTFRKVEVRWSGGDVCSAFVVGIVLGVLAGLALSPLVQGLT